MASNKFSRGSEWRKWDLHVHTPKSMVQNYGGDTPEAWEKFISNLENLPKEFKAIGINDYIFIDGYKEVLRYRSEGRIQNIDLILPIIELRIDKFASIGDEAWRKINFHVIFSNEIAPEIIEAQFLNAIQHSIKLSPDIEGVEFKGIATLQSLEELGRKIKENSTTPINWPDLKVGFWNLYFDYKTVKSITEGYFKDNCITAVGKSEWDTMRWDGSAALKKTIINEATFSFISLAKPGDYQKHIDALEKQKVKSLLLDCSDAHFFSESTEKDRIGNSFTWLKADTTFEGLKQVATGTDRSRIYVGDEPPLLLRVRNNPTKYIKSLKINKINGSDLTQEWFNPFEIALNSALVAIIGNKGNGESAITDTIGLLGNTINYLDFSFLNDKKFRKRKPLNLSEHFEATLTWENGVEDYKPLRENPNETSVEKIKYIPQNFLEKLCNEDVDDFERELRKVIFSHITDTDRLGQSNLEDLIAYKTEIINEEIDIIKKGLFEVNKIIVELEKKELPEYSKNIQEKLKEKGNELNAHESLKPQKVDPPSDPIIIAQNKVISDAIEKKRDKLKELEESILEKQTKVKNLKLTYSELDKAKQSITVFESQFEKLKVEISSIFATNKIKFDDIISVKINKLPIQEELDNQKTEADKIDDELKSNEEKSLLFQRKLLNKEIKDLKQKLDEPSLIYQKYVDELKEWENKKVQIVGSKEYEGSLENLKEQLAYIQISLKEELKTNLDKRKLLLTQLYAKKNHILEFYKELFKPITDFIEKYGEVLNSHSINLDVDYKLSGFVEKFFDHISLGSKGSFIGNPAGYERLKQIIDSNDLGIEEGLVHCIEEIIENLKEDHRDGFKNERRSVENQLKKGYSVLDLYSFLFNLEYLEPIYKLKLGDKNISELSPGERGALLLIFYLTLDQEDIPLIIDQPEENLDNQSVYNILVHFIIKAKERRQIIIVTHNPNLAVVCDAEQIVHVHIDKMNKNKVEYFSGSLENPIINNAVVDILEGTFPAFDTRTLKYKIIERKKL